ncbi:hypothetical protein HWV07_13410 [Natronomonas salina]|uniref:hypothetical protein n=1 Tax=Natronomonas salina TaxID=1710540 RepID=UPI0015B4F748|nr:hypothetical protein [Natronomonas salina]QLD89973.1 hypothetical protein HWV07_13410 [Natronomonas salina]
MADGIETTRTAVADGVRVRKTIDTGPEETAVVTLNVAVEHTEPTTVRITESALGAVPRDEIELHTDHGAEHWQIGDEATFEREFAGGETSEVVYRVAGVDADRFEALDEGPVVAAGGSIDDLVSRDDSDAVRALVAGERESLLAAPGAGGVDLSFETESDPDGEAEDVVPTATASSGGPAEDSSADEIPVDTEPEDISVGVPSMDGSADGDAAPSDPAVEAAEPVEADEPTDGARDQAHGQTPDDDLTASLAATPSGGIARLLLKELREGHVDEETREELRAELEPGRSRDVRIKHLQSEVAEFAAYVEMLDGFVDEHGTLDDAVGGVDEQVSSLDDELASVRSELDDISDSVNEDVGELQTDVADLRDGQGDLRDGQDDLEARLDRLEDELATVDERLDEFDEFKERLSGVFQGVGDPQE